jgi:serine/threonine protein kinase
LREIINHKLVVRDSYSSIVDCYGISQAPDTGNYVMVMRYIEGGNLRQFLQDNYQQLSFSNRLFQLFNIVQGLQSIHETNLVHHDFHPGNLLNLLHDNCSYIFITDLGLSRPANEINKEKIYGVLPYVAPEVLRKKKYTAAADIYSFGMIAYELFSGKHPFYEYVHDGEFYRALAFRICEGLRPNLKEVIAPQLLRDLISRCWDAQPEQRPTAGDL